MKMACRSHSAKQGHRAMPNQSGRLMKQSLLTRHIQTSCGHCAAITNETNPVIGNIILLLQEVKRNFITFQSLLRKDYICSFELSLNS